MTKAFAAGLSAIALIGAPVAAAPVSAPVNPAGRLSIAPTLRAATPAVKGDRLAGGGSIAAIIGAVLVVVGIVIVATDDDSDSN